MTKSNASYNTTTFSDQETTSALKSLLGIGSFSSNAAQLTEWPSPSKSISTKRNKLDTNTRDNRSTDKVLVKVGDQRLPDHVPSQEYFEDKHDESDGGSGSKQVLFSAVKEVSY